MPSPRKRIGFLPSLEVQDIIDKICNNLNLSQSKVTGILVEEALLYRGAFENKTLNDSKNKDLERVISEKNEILDNSEVINIKNPEVDEEIKMINEFIEYKLFKKIMRKNRYL